MASVEETSGALRRCFFLWVWPFMQQSYKHIGSGLFSLASLPSFPQKECSQHAVETLAEQMRAEVERCKQTGRSPSLHRAMFRCWKGLLAREVLRAVIFSCLFVLTPFLLQQTIRSLRAEERLEAILWLVALPMSGMLGGLVQQHGFHAFTLFGRQTWAGLVGNIFQKLTTLDSAASSQKITEGEIVSMIGQDASIFPYMSPFLCIFLAIPGNVVLPAVIMTIYLGRAFLAGLGACILLTIFSNCAAAKYKQKVKEKLRVADERLVLINESLQGARSVKLCAWECALEAKINRVREKEIRLLRWIHLCYALQQGAVSALPVVGISTALLTYIALGFTLEADVVAMTVAYFDYLALGFMLFPNCKLQLQVMSAGVSRVERLLLQKDVEVPSDSEGDGAGIFMENACFSWSDASTLVKDVSMSVKPGELVVVVGPVACGKSTLVSGVFGFAHLVPPGISKLRGEPAYVPQNPQVLNASVCDNILFGAEMHPARYDAALAACCLEQDMDQLVDGDATEIGEKGITISGGQRARIAMARAFYADPDVVVLDDPLSAMDAHVGARVFQQCIMTLKHRGKAVLMTTNQLQYCAAADHIIILEEGRVAHQGPFDKVSEVLVKTCGMTSQVDVKEVADGTEGKLDKGISTVALRERSKKTLKSGMTAEAVVQGRLTVTSWRALAAAAGGSSSLLGAALVAACVGNPLAMYVANILLAQWTQADEQDSNGMVYYIVAALVFAVCCCLRVLFSALYFTQLSRHLHQKMLASVLRQSMVWYDTTPLGRILNRFSQDIALMDLQMPRIFEFAMQHLTVVAVGILGASVLAWPVLVLLLLVAVPLYKLQNRYNAVALNLQRLMLMATSPVMSQVSSFLIARDTIRAFRRERHFVADFIHSMDDFYRSYYWIHGLDRLTMSIFTVFFVPALMLCLGGAVLCLIHLDLLTPELGGMALALSIGLAQRITLYLWCWSTFEKFFGAAQRVAEYAALKWEGSQKDHDAWRKPLDQPVDEGGSQLALVMKDVSLRYQPGLPLALDGLNLKVHAGERIGICGRTGSGKSTLFLACFRLVEMDAGDIEIWGRSVQSLTLPELRSKLAIVPQDPLMFSGTLRFNLDFQGHHSDEEIWTALRLARLEKLVMDLPLQLEETVQEKGANFSAGTIQLICIARILMAHQRIVFLDECTANVDTNTDSEVQKAVRSACQDCAVICIAHRLQTIMDYDQLAVMDSGKVVEFGPPNDLLTRNGPFAKLASSSGDQSPGKNAQRGLLSL